MFCLSRNKVTRLPEYISKFHNLCILEVERNPIEWPPSAVMDRPYTFSTPEAMKEWVNALQTWIERDTADPEDSGYVDVSKMYVSFPLGPAFLTALI